MHPQTYLLTLLTAITTLCHAQAVPGHYDQFLDRNPIDHNPNGLNTTGLHPCIKNCMFHDDDYAFQMLDGWETMTPAQFCGHHATMRWYYKRNIAHRCLCGARVCGRLDEKQMHAIGQSTVDWIKKTCGQDFDHVKVKHFRC